MRPNSFVIELWARLERLKVSPHASHRNPFQLNRPCAVPELYMLPFSPFLRQYFTAKELQDWAEIMVEKGIRIRLPFEQYWRSTSATDYLDRDDGGDPMKEEDRVFDFLQERKTLMPY